jgi:carbon monoxide dehydrogenase subunit G
MLLLAIMVVELGAPGLPVRPAADDSPAASLVTVREDRGVYRVTARFHVPQAGATVLAVLTDYEQIPTFMPGIQSSVVLERASGRAVVEQKAVSRLMMFSKQVHLVLEIVEGPGGLAFRDRSGDSFAVYEGTWRLTPRDGGTEIVYELTAKPSFDVPEFVLKRLLKRDSAKMIDALRREIAGRPAQRYTAHLWPTEMSSHDDQSRARRRLQ